MEALLFDLMLVGGAQAIRVSYLLARVCIARMNGLVNFSFAGLVNVANVLPEITDLNA